MKISDKILSKFVGSIQYFDLWNHYSFLVIYLQLANGRFFKPWSSVNGNTYNYARWCLELSEGSVAILAVEVSRPLVFGRLEFIASSYLSCHFIFLSSLLELSGPVLFK